MSLKNLPFFFILIAVLFFGLFFFIENNNESFLLNDFKVYYSASQVVLDGGQPYGVAYGLGSGFFKYSPVALSFLALTRFSHLKRQKFYTLSLLPFFLSELFFFVFSYRIDILK